MTGLTHPTGKKAADIITRRAMAFDAIVEAVYHDGPDTEWSADEIADVARIIEEFGFTPDGRPERESRHDRAIGVLSTLVTGLDEGESPATLLNYINLQARDVVEKATGEDTANGQLATEEQRAACRVDELLTVFRELLEICRWKCSTTDEVILPAGKTNHEALIGATELLNAIDHPAPEPTTP